MAAKTTIKWPFTPGIHAQTETLNAPGKWQILANCTKIRQFLADCTHSENGFYWPLMCSQCLAVPLEARHKVRFERENPFRNFPKKAINGRSGQFMPCVTILLGARLAEMIDLLPAIPGPWTKKVQATLAKRGREQIPLYCTMWDGTGRFQAYMAHFSRFSLIGPERYGTSAAFPACYPLKETVLSCTVLHQALQQTDGTQSS